MKTLERLSRIAAAEVKALVRSLPSPLRLKAETIPVEMEDIPSRSFVASGIGPDSMGLFEGDAMNDPRDGGGNPCPLRILLFLRNIWDESGHDEKTFRREVRTTYYHELGHYLGLEETDLTSRDLA